MPKRLRKDFIKRLRRTGENAETKSNLRGEMIKQIAVIIMTTRADTRFIFPKMRRRR